MNRDSEEIEWTVWSQPQYTSKEDLFDALSSDSFVVYVSSRFENEINDTR